MGSTIGVGALPDEVLEIIFSFYIGWASRRSPVYQKQATICSICSRWRGVAISNAHLWSQIHVHVDNKYPTTQLLRLYLKRSSNRPLDTVIWFMSPAGSPSKDDKAGFLQRTLRVLLSHPHRWRTLTTSLGPNLSRILHGVQSKKGQQFEGLHLWTDGDRALNRLLSSTQSAYARDQYPDRPPSHWSKLPHLGIACFLPWSEIFEAATRCSSLVTLKIENYDKYYSCENRFFPPPRPTGLPNLRALHISSGTIFSAVFPQLDLPQLEVLSLESKNERECWLDLLTSARHFKSLKYLTVMAPHLVTPDMLSQASTALPALASIPIFQAKFFTTMDSVRELQTHVRTILSIQCPEMLQHFGARESLYKAPTTPPHDSTYRAIGWCDLQTLRDLRVCPDFQDFGFDTICT